MSAGTGANAKLLCVTATQGSVADAVSEKDIREKARCCITLLSSVPSSDGTLAYDGSESVGKTLREQ